MNLWIALPWLAAGVWTSVARAHAIPVECPDFGNPGNIGNDQAALRVDPPMPDAGDTLTITVGAVYGSQPIDLALVRVDHTINVIVSAIGPGNFITPPPVGCLSASIGPLDEGTYVTRALVTWTDDDAGITAVGNSPLQVAALPGNVTPSLAINGLMSSNWYDPAHVGEGMVVQVAAFPPTPDGIIHKELVWDWFTYDANGNPFWIAGNAPVDPDDPTHVTSPAVYSTDGGFAGDFGANATQNPWGTVAFTFPDINHVTVEYTANEDLPDGVPGGSGTLDYQRLLDIDGLACDPTAQDCIP
ncbi:MAG TPA: hypothetical protein VFG55_00410 [Rhodanobacteraceae bacterium]|nr:hypothetical protein [Rhodanobacteraceae bacterium]